MQRCVASPLRSAASQDVGVRILPFPLCCQIDGSSRVEYVLAFVIPQKGAFAMTRYSAHVSNLATSQMEKAREDQVRE